MYDSAEQIAAQVVGAKEEQRPAARAEQVQVRIEKSPKLVGRAAREKANRIHGLGIDEILALPRAGGRVLPHAVDKGSPVKAPPRRRKSGSSAEGRGRIARGAGRAGKAR